MQYAMFAACSSLILVLAVPRAARARRLARLFRAGGVGRDDGPPRATPSAMPPGGPVARPARRGRRILSSHPPRAPPWPSCLLDSLTADSEPEMPDDIAP